MPAFGPIADAAQLEGSKAYAKEVMAAAGVPTADYTVVGDVEDGLAAISSYPVALKADGLAAGKGVVIAADEDEARATLDRHDRRPSLRRRAGRGRGVPRGRRAVRARALRRRQRALPLAPARDFKRIGEGDTGPNTGGMGAFSPVDGVDAALIERVRTRDLPAGRGRARAPRTPFHGVLYAGLMLTRPARR